MHRQGSRSWAVCLVLTLAGLFGCTAVKNAVAARSTPTPSNGLTVTTAGSPAAPGAFPGPPGGPVPVDFAAASATFVSPQTGWVLGTAPCGSGLCTSLVRTRDGGKTWVAIPAPAADLSVAQPSGVAKIRFADADNGWAFGPELWATHDGGAHWSRSTPLGLEKGHTVSDLAAAAGVVHASVVDTNGVRILTSPVRTDDWQSSSTTVPLGAGPAPQAQLVLQGSAGWLIQVNRTVIGGARLSDSSWIPWQPPCAAAGGPAYLAAPSATDLVAVCNEGMWTGATQAVRAYASSDGGTTFHPIGVALPLSCCAAVASGQPGVAVVAENSGDGTASLQANLHAGSTWTRVYRGQSGQSWTDLAFTGPSQGVAVAVQANPHVGSLLMTLDGGRTWRIVPIR